jgi:hypothetical protein
MRQKIAGMAVIEDDLSVLCEESNATSRRLPVSESVEDTSRALKVVCGPLAAHSRSDGSRQHQRSPNGRRIYVGRSLSIADQSDSFCAGYEPRRTLCGMWYQPENSSDAGVSQARPQREPRMSLEQQG